ncbi:uncharacterized protein LOC125503360 isoform X2 [Dendroctonus ponderosae]|uniref:Uncharacterized protein n=1 Tax=Dendroctonus ponderosae TaxID=77166 RepID=U4UMP7_DENPD|nr:uncharacterized protein LOC125503360 isoform X2 [Dendroctonus ponderosae]ERL95334.1 hypothetical protein D910_12599 [Dendroctonus ponderosae]
MFPHGAIMFQHWMDVVNNPALSKLAHTTVRRCYSVCNNHVIVSQFQTPERKTLLTKAILKSFIAPSNICMPPASDSETHPHTGIQTSHDDSTSVEREQESTFSMPTHNVDSEIG